MPPELRKRKAPVAEPAPDPPAPKKKAVANGKDVVAAAAPTETETVTATPKTKTKIKPKTNSNNTNTNGTTAASKVAPGEVISLDTFGGEIETNDGKKTTLQKLLDESEAGVVLFTYPKASTPGCTTQACLFRDQYTSLTATGLSIYGLSKDSPKANTTFREKQKLPYPLLCDQNATLISAIGFKKAPAGTKRGVFVINKSSKVLAAELGGPAATVEVVKKLVANQSAADEDGTTNGATKVDFEKAETVTHDSDTAEKLHSAE